MKFERTKKGEIIELITLVGNKSDARVSRKLSASIQRRNFQSTGRHHLDIDRGKILSYDGQIPVRAGPYKTKMEAGS